MRQKHPKVTAVGKYENMMKNTVIKHSKKHEKKGIADKDVDLLPDRSRKG
jgi:hypothetical protein